MYRAYVFSDITIFLIHALRKSADLHALGSYLLLIKWESTLISSLVCLPSRHSFCSLRSCFYSQSASGDEHISHLRIYFLWIHCSIHLVTLFLHLESTSITPSLFLFFTLARSLTILPRMKLSHPTLFFFFICCCRILGYARIINLSA